MSSPNSPTGPPDKNRTKELSNEVRMLIAFALMGAILLATPFVYRKLGVAPPPTDAKTQAAQKTNPDQAIATAGGAPITSSAAPAPEPSEPLAGAISAGNEQEQVIDTDLYHVVFSNRGATVKSWTLKKFTNSAEMPLELVNLKGDEKVGRPFAFTFRDKQPSTDLNKALWVAHPAGDGLTINYEYSDGRTHATKTFALERGGYMVQYADEVTLNGAPLPHLVEWRGGFGDMAVEAAPGHQATIYYDTENNKLKRRPAKDGKNGPSNADGVFSFAGIDDQYFAAAFLPPANTKLETTTYDDIVASPVNTAEDSYPGVAVGGAARNQFGVYIGPKTVSLLHQVNPKLDGIVYWGWFGVVAKPLFLVLHFLNDSFVHDYGWSLILLTILINMALFPLKLTSLKSSRKMQKLQPEMNKITEKYKGIGMSDPKAANKQQEIMDLYKKHGVNPMGGCLPLVIQMPFIYAFYKVLGVSIEMRHASWLWVGDLSQPEHFAIRFLPLIMVATSFGLQKMTPPPATGDASQQKMMQFMPLMYLFFFWSASSGLVLYWLTGNLVGMGQQWFFNKTAGPVELKAISKDGKKRT